MDFDLDYKDGKLYRKGKDYPAEMRGSGVYRMIRYKGKRYYQHRVIWEMHNGPIPEDRCIDHINRDKKDNRIENLRCVTTRQNNQNTMGKRGFIYDDNYTNPYRVMVGSDLIGRFTNALDARAEYLREKRKRGII